MNRRLLEEAARRCRVAPGKPLDLADHPADWLPVEPRDEAHKDDMKEEAEDLLKESRAALADAQDLLHAADSRALLVILQGLDAAGKDGIVRHVMDGVNPMGCEVHSFKAPSDEELDHDFLWRAAKRLPERGKIGIFNRSHYEEVLVVRVHPQFLEKQRLPPLPPGLDLWQERFRSIRDFERHLALNGTTVRKFYLNVSLAEQRRRLIDRLDEPKKFWKFNLGDSEERAHRADYDRVYAEALAATSTEAAPWYVIPADRKWFARALVAQVLCETVAAMDLAWPQPDAKDRAEMAEARRILEAD